MPTRNARPTLRRTWLLAALASLATWTVSPAAAQEWPAARPVKLIVPFATGGSADVFGRLLAQRLQEALGQSVVVENRPGGGAIIGTDAAAKSPPDGYTLLVMSNTHTVNESLIPNKPYQLMRDFVGVAPINASDLVLVARSGLPQSNPRELLAAAKARPDGMTYASSGPGTPYHMAGELLKAMAGVKIVHVPYKGSAQARTDVLGGQVDMMFDAIPTMVEQVVMSLDEHDRLIAYVLGLSHALNIAFLTALAGSGEAAPRLARMSSTTFDAQLDIAAKVAQESPDLYFEIQALNDYGAASLEALAQAVERLRRTVLSRDREAFRELMTRGRDYLEDRRRITAQRA